jgi:RNA polymerase sigma factor (sigma-70 family)
MPCDRDIDRVYTQLLLVAARGGDREAGNRLAARWYPRLLSTARRLLRDDDLAREAVQETWIAICRGWLSLRDPARFPAWAFGILHRRCADAIRAAKLRRSRLAPEDESSEPSTREADIYGVALHEALGALSHDHRVAAILFFHQGLTLAELAEATGVPLGTAKSRVFHARQHLRAHLEGDD